MKLDDLTSDGQKKTEFMKDENSSQDSNIFILKKLDGPETLSGET